ncbi:hypothetical protein ABNIH4_09744 [Acinetobacter baumannii ABNIH4]|nr:hypothetical protein ABNIH4_09744 [Acinetobacter baumannii ABNIH4]
MVLMLSRHPLSIRQYQRDWQAQGSWSLEPRH